MIYWIFLIGSFIVLVISLFFIWKKRIKDDDMENETLGVTIFIACVSLICLITFSLDIPCALRGGQEMYVNELPSYIGCGRFRRTITDNEELKHLNGCTWDAYEKYGNYHIRYTKITKVVLDIEKLD